ncbi:hypothetical protein P7C70_g6001, partial [Phenoliferia sp. Uapishka_3]
MHVILAGGNGTVGSAILAQALLHPSITRLTLLLRRPLALSLSSPKLHIIIHEDFLSYPPALLEQLKGAQACLWAIGVTGVGAKVEGDYEKITRDFAVEAAKAFAALREDGEKFVFCFLSAATANQAVGKAWGEAGRVRGEAEATLVALTSTLPLATYFFRPAPVRSSNPTVPFTTFQNIRFYLMSRFVIDDDVISNAMIQAALQGGSGEIEGWEGKGKPGNEGAFGIGEMKLLAAESVLAKKE